MSDFNHQEEVKEQDLTQEVQTAESEIQEIQEFVVSSEQARSERKKAEQESISAIAAWSSGKKRVALLALFAAAALIYILVGILACEVNAVVVCFVLVVQVAIGVLLDQNPIWLHGCVAAADVIVGLCVGQTLLMIFAMLVYVAAIGTLEALQRMGMPVKA